MAQTAAEHTGVELSIRCQDGRPRRDPKGLARVGSVSVHRKGADTVGKGDVMGGGGA